MVLAAGLGTRLRPITYEMPKPMVPVLNRPVMEHIVRLLARHGFTEAIANRTDPARRHLDVAGTRRARLATLGAAGGVGLAAGLGYAFGAGAVYSRWTAQDWLLRQVQKALDYIQEPTTFLFRDLTNPIGNFLVQHMLQPLDTFLVETPWFVTLGGLVAIAFVLSGLRPAVTTALMFAMIGVIGEWQPAMDTFSQVLVATVIAVAIGIVLGVWAAESATVRSPRSVPFAVMKLRAKRMMTPP